MDGHNTTIINNTAFYELNVLNIKDGNYLISKDGQIYSKVRRKVLKHKIDKDGYHEVHLSLNGRKDKYFRVALLVLHQFVGSPPNDMLDPTSQHIDGNIDNNNLDNLMWMERGENSSKRVTSYVGERNPSAMLTESQVLEIAELLKTDQYTLQNIADMYNVHKSTISNIRRKKNWKYLLSDYNFPILNVGSKESQKQKKQQVLQLFQDGYTPTQIIKMGYSNSSVYRWLSNCSSTGAN